MKTLTLGIVALALPGLWAADIDWKVAPATQSDADVRVAGRSVFAYTASTKGNVVVNGVPFTYPGGSLVSGVEGFAASDQTTRWEPNFMENLSAYGQTWTGTTAYYNLLGASWYRNGTSAFTSQVTVSGLSSGKRYLIQLWVCDNRNNHKSDAFTLGGESHTFGNRACGLTAVGLFTADAATQSFEMPYSQNGNLNAVQLRCLDEAEGPSWRVSSTGVDGSVVGRGRLLYAFCGAGATVAGTPFAAMGSLWQKKTSLGDGDIALVSGAANQMSVDLHDFYVDAATMAARGFVPTESAVTNLLGGGIFVDGGSGATLTLNKLTAGHRYLVQMWFLDARSGGTSKSATFGGRTVSFRNDATAPAGQFVTGVFRADGASQDVFVKMNSPQINAIQVRDLGEVAWTVRMNAGDESLVSTEGEPAYAYTPSAALTLDNGVAFAAAAAKQNVWGDGDVTLEKKWSYSYSGFVDSSKTAVMSEKYGTLLNRGWYNLEDSSNAQTLTLGNLDAGCEYLVQLVLDDLRSGNKSSMKMSVGGVTGQYGPSSLTAKDWAYGSVFDGRFVAKAASETVALSYSHTGGTVQLNAIQVRKTATPITWNGGASGTWTTDGADWQKGGTPLAGMSVWSAENGPTNTAHVAGDVTLTLGSDIWVESVYGTGNLTIGASGADKALFVSDEVSAPLLTLNAVWPQADFVKTRGGCTVLAGAAPFLSTVRVLDGSVRLAKATAAPLTICVTAPGALAPAVQGDESINLGCCMFSGDADLTGLRFAVGNAAAREGETVLTVSGTVTGSPAFDCDDATYRVVRKGNAWTVKKKLGLLLIFK